jgi:hypothetical protein
VKDQESFDDRKKASAAQEDGKKANAAKKPGPARLLQPKKKVVKKMPNKK